MTLADFFMNKPRTFSNIVMAITGLIVGPITCLRHSTVSHLFSDILGLLTCAVLGYLAVFFPVLVSVLISGFVLSKIEVTDEKDEAKLVLASCATLIVVAIALLIASGGSIFEPDHSREMGDP